VTRAATAFASGDAASATVPAMDSLPSLPPRARRVLEVARRDRAAAMRELASLAVPDQVALVCDTPVQRRSEILELLPFPEQVVPEMPDAELCFTARAIGLADADWLLEYATPTQVVACLDLDAWNPLEPDLPALDEWIDALAGTSPRAFARSLLALDPELLTIYLRHRIDVVLKPDEKEGWDPPPGSQTLDGQFYFAARAADDDLAPVVSALRILFENDYWTSFRMLQAVLWELPSENQEWAIRWRTGRLQDLGFPPWNDAMDLYRYLDADARARIPPDTRPLEVTEWHLPTWVPTLPAAADSRHLIFRAIAELPDSERRSAFYAFTAVVNKVAVADGMKLGDAEFAPRAIEKAADLASIGLEYLAAQNRLPAAEVLQRVPIERLFRVGANLDPERARARVEPDADDENAEGPPVE